LTTSGLPGLTRSRCCSSSAPAGYSPAKSATSRNRRQSGWPPCSRRPRRPPYRDMTERVLVTGATGFIGGRLAARLASSAREVRCLVRDRGGTRARELERAGFELHEA